MQSLTLTRRQLSQYFLKSTLHLGSFKFQLYMRTGDGADYRVQAAQKLLATLADSGFANHPKKPRLQLRFASEDGLTLQDLQVNHLQHFFGVTRVLATTTQRPAKTGRMKFFKFRFELRNLHSREPCSEY